MTPTGRRKAKSGGQSHSLGLADQVTTQSWATPQQGDYRSPNLNPGAQGTSESAKAGLLPQSEHALPAQTGGKLNPSWVETLQGFPIGWTQLPYRFKKGKR
jgi:hypothetical protein